MIFVPWLMFVEPGSWLRVWVFVRHRPVATIVPILIAGAIVAPYARHFYSGNPERRSPHEAAAFSPAFDDWIVARPGKSVGRPFDAATEGRFLGRERCFRGFLRLYAIYVLA